MQKGLALLLFCGSITGCYGEYRLCEEEEYLYINPQALTACRGDFGEDNVLVSGGEGAVSPYAEINVENSDGIWRTTYADENGSFGLLTTSEEQAYLRVLINYAGCAEDDSYKVELNLEVQESCEQ